MHGSWLAYVESKARAHLLNCYNAARTALLTEFASGLIGVKEEEERQKWITLEVVDRERVLTRIAVEKEWTSAMKERSVERARLCDIETHKRNEILKEYLQESLDVLKDSSLQGQGFTTAEEQRLRNSIQAEFEREHEPAALQNEEWVGRLRLIIERLKWFNRLKLEADAVSTLYKVYSTASKLSVELEEFGMRTLLYQEYENATWDLVHQRSTIRDILFRQESRDRGRIESQRKEYDYIIIMEQLPLLFQKLETAQRAEIESGQRRTYSEIIRDSVVKQPAISTVNKRLPGTLSVELVNIQEEETKFRTKIEAEEWKAFLTLTCECKVYAPGANVSEALAHLTEPTVVASVAAAPISVYAAAPPAATLSRPPVHVAPLTSLPLVNIELTGRQLLEQTEHADWIDLSATLAGNHLVACRWDITLQESRGRQALRETQTAARKTLFNDYQRSHKDALIRAERRFRQHIGHQSKEEMLLIKIRFERKAKEVRNKQSSYRLCLVQAAARAKIAQIFTFTHLKVRRAQQASVKQQFSKQASTLVEEWKKAVNVLTEMEFRARQRVYSVAEYNRRRATLKWLPKLTEDECERRRKLIGLEQTEREFISLELEDALYEWQLANDRLSELQVFERTEQTTRKNLDSMHEKQYEMIYSMWLEGMGDVMKLQVVRKKQKGIQTDINNAIHMEQTGRLHIQDSELDIRKEIYMRLQRGILRVLAAELTQEDRAARNKIIEDERKKRYNLLSLIDDLTEAARTDIFTGKTFALGYEEEEARKKVGKRKLREFQILSERFMNERSAIQFNLNRKHAATKIQAQVKGMLIRENMSRYGTPTKPQQPDTADARSEVTTTASPVPIESSPLQCHTPIFPSDASLPSLPSLTQQPASGSSPLMAVSPQFSSFVAPLHSKPDIRQRKGFFNSSTAALDQVMANYKDDAPMLSAVTRTHHLYALPTKPTDSETGSPAYRKWKKTFRSECETRERLEMKTREEGSIATEEAIAMPIKKFVSLETGNRTKVRNEEKGAWIKLMQHALSERMITVQNASGGKDNFVNRLDAPTQNTVTPVLRMAEIMYMMDNNTKPLKHSKGSPASAPAGDGQGGGGLSHLRASQDDSILSASCLEVDDDKKKIGALCNQLLHLVNESVQTEKTWANNLRKLNRDIVRPKEQWTHQGHVEWEAPTTKKDRHKKHIQLFNSSYPAAVPTGVIRKGDSTKLPSLQAAAVVAQNHSASEH